MNAVLDKEEAIYFDPADPSLTVEQAIDRLITDGDDPREAERIVKYARGIWARKLTRTTIIDGVSVTYLVN